LASFLLARLTEMIRIALPRLVKIAVQSFFPIIAIKILLCSSGYGASISTRLLSFHRFSSIKINTMLYFVGMALVFIPFKFHNNIILILYKISTKIAEWGTRVESVNDRQYGAIR
jgi:hypothetical protein